jgi:hypothetical protein
MSAEAVSCAAEERACLFFRRNVQQALRVCLHLRQAADDGEL